MRRATLALTAVTSILAVSVSVALAAGYGHGRFVGKAKPEFGGGKATPITVKVKGSRVRVVEMTFSFDCASDGSVLKRTIATPFVKVHKGPAGGGATSTARSRRRRVETPSTWASPSASVRRPSQGSPTAPWTWRAFPA